MTAKETILDLGSGTGGSWRYCGLPADDWRVLGLPIARDRLQVGRTQYGVRGWRYICSRGENVPLADASVHGVLCWVASPYMHIPRTVAKVHRVSDPGGFFKAALHDPAFTWSELRKAFPKPKPSLFRVFVLLNGMIPVFSGSVISLRQVA